MLSLRLLLFPAFETSLNIMKPPRSNPKLSIPPNLLGRLPITPLRHSLPQPFRSQSTLSPSESRLPRIAQSSTWQSIIPRFLRQRTSSTPGLPKKASNPANYFIWIYILIGSQAIRILSLKNEFRNYTRQADLKLAKLREVIGKLQRGEQVDVEKVLGTGDEIAEREWEEALREIESEERMWQNNSKKKRQMQEREEERRREREGASPVNQEGGTVADVGGGAAMVPHAPGFY